MSFWKHEPPKPTDERKNCWRIRGVTVGISLASRNRFWARICPPFSQKHLGNRLTLLPIRTSLPTARATSSTSACVTSQSCEIALIEEIRCARKALATSLDSSEDQRFVVIMRSLEIHFSYTAARLEGVVDEYRASLQVEKREARDVRKGFRA